MAGAVATRKPFEVTDQGIAVIVVTGTLVHRAAAAPQPASGALTAYTNIEAEVLEAATDPRVQALAGRSAPIARAVLEEG